MELRDNPVGAAAGQSRAGGADMESATIAATLPSPVPYGHVLCALDQTAAWS